MFKINFEQICPLFRVNSPIFVEERKRRGLTLVAQLVSSPWNQSGCSSLLLNAVFESSLFKAVFRTATFAFRFSARNSDAFSPAIRKSILTRLNVSYRRSASVTIKKKVFSPVTFEEFAIRRGKERKELKRVREIRKSLFFFFFF